MSQTSWWWWRNQLVSWLLVGIHAKKKTYDESLCVILKPDFRLQPSIDISCTSFESCFDQHLCWFFQRINFCFKSRAIQSRSSSKIGWLLCTRHTPSTSLVMKSWAISSLELHLIHQHTHFVILTFESNSGFILSPHTKAIVPQTAPSSKEIGVCLLEKVVAKFI